MPTYGYRCPSCSTEFDVWQRMSDPAGAECPNCGTAARRLFFPAGIVFKGTGFYATDHRSRSSDGATPASSTPPDGKADTAKKTTPATPSADTSASSEKST